MPTSYNSQRQDVTTVTYVPFGSFQRPTLTDSPMANQSQQTNSNMQSPDVIRNEVTSSFKVKPLYPRPCFPKQAQVLALSAEKNNAITMQLGGVGGVHCPKRSNLIHAIDHRGELSIQPHPLQNPNQPGDENFVYIHRQNSFIDVSKMTHHNHSPECQDSSTRSRTRSHDEVDAAMALVSCLQK